MSLDTKNKNIHGSGVGISTVFMIFEYFLFLGGGDHSRGSCPTYYMMNLDTSNKNITVEVSTVFKMFSNFLFREGLLLLLLLLGYTYHLMRHAKTNKNINGLRITIQ